MSHDGGKSLRDRIARSKQVVKSGKRQKMVKEPVSRRSISLSEMQVGRPVRWRILGDKGAGFAITKRTTIATDFTDGRASTNVVEATTFQHAEQLLVCTNVVHTSMYTCSTSMYTCSTSMHTCSTSRYSCSTSMYTCSTSNMHSHL
jgi:hypothetical protein